MRGLQRLRAGVILAGVWGLTWMIGGSALGAWGGFLVLPGTPLDLRLEWAGRGALSAAATYGRIAWAVGALFAGGLTLALRGRTLESLRMRSVAATGAVAGGLQALLTIAMADGLHQVPAPALMQPIVLGAASGLATLAVARRASRDAVPSPGSDPASMPQRSAAGEASGTLLGRGTGTDNRGADRQGDVRAPHGAATR